MVFFFLFILYIQELLKYVGWYWRCITHIVYAINDSHGFPTNDSVNDKKKKKLEKNNNT